MVKIWAICNWLEVYDNGSFVDRLKRNWPIPDNIVFDEKEYEYLLVFGGFRQDNIKYFKDKQKTLGFILEPEWSTNWQRDLDKYCKFIYAQDKGMFPGGLVMEFPSIMLTQSTDSYDYYLANRFPKTKRMSFVSSNYNHGKNYIKRYELFNALLSTNLDIDFYGRGWDLRDPRYKGSPYNKSEGIREYEYSIAIENSCYKNYLTEKFFDLTLCNTVPIYYGATNADEIYPKESFININLEDKIEKVVAKIVEIYYMDNYKNRVNYLIEAKNKYYSSYNAFEILNKLINNKEI